MIDYKALHERCRREGKSTLDLDDLAAGHPVAEAELTEYARLRMAVDDALTSFHLAIESFDTPEQALDELLDQQGALAAYFATERAVEMGRRYDRLTLEVERLQKEPSFGSPEVLADWLEGLHETTPDGAVCANKWEAAQIAAKAVRGQAEPAPAAVPDGYTLVPNSALRWLFGEEGEFLPEQTPGKSVGNYWWRSVFRKMIAAPTPTDPQEE